MFIEAYSEKEAIVLARRSYGYLDAHIKVKPIKEPINMIWGLIRKRGQYEIVITMPEKKHIGKSNDQSYKNGYVEIQDGNLKVVDPIDNGRYPSISIDDSNIDVYINGIKQKGSLVITEKDVIEFKPKIIEPLSKISVEITEDKMQAILNINKQEGKRFYVKNAKKDVNIRICSRFENIRPKNVTLTECIETLTDAGIKLEFVDADEINRLISLPNGGIAIVAKGRAPIEGVKAEIKYYFSHSNQSNDSLDNKEQIIDDKQIVQIGDVLATKLILTIQGKDGLTVTGEKIKAKEIEDESLIGGKGVIILDNGIKAVAAVSGRPVVEDGIISVIPLLVISKDVNKDTGNIDFDGDVIIKGSIMDNMKVAAKGNIEVLGSVYNSEVISSRNINIFGKVIASKIRAGVSVIEYFCIVPQMEKVVQVVKKLLEYVKIHKKINRLMLRTIVQTEKKVIETSIKEIKSALSIMGNDEADNILILLKDVRKILLLMDDLFIKDIRQIININKEVFQYINSVKTSYESNANVCLEYAQNSTIQACGHIVITGEGSYLSNLFAKETITYKRYSSNVKGGILIAGKNIEAGTIGSSTGIRTYCKVLDEKGKINANYCDGTIININNRTKIINTEENNEYYSVYNSFKN